MGVDAKMANVDGEIGNNNLSSTKRAWGLVTLSLDVTLSLKT